MCQCSKVVTNNISGFKETKINFGVSSKTIIILNKYPDQLYNTVKLVPQVYLFSQSSFRSIHKREDCSTVNCLQYRSNNFVLSFLTKVSFVSIVINLNQVNRDGAAYKICRCLLPIAWSHFGSGSLFSIDDDKYAFHEYCMMLTLSQCMNCQCHLFKCSINPN